MNTRIRKILRDIEARKARTLLVSMAIFIGVMGVVTLTSGGNIIVEQLKADLQPKYLPMVGHFLRLPDGVTLSDAENAEILEALRQSPGVTILEGRLDREVFWKLPDADSAFIQGRITANSESFEQIQIEPPQVIDGAYPVAGQKQLAIERRMAERYSLQVGDAIILRNLTDLETRLDPTAPIPEETWTISAILFHPFNEGGYNTLYSTYADISQLTRVRGYTAVVARFTDFATAEAQNDALRDRLAETPYLANGDFIANPDENALVEEIEQWSVTLTSLAVIAMLVSSFLVVTVISTIMAEQRRQIGVMKSLGASRWDNIFMYTGIALLYGVIGMIPGVLLGIPLGYLLADYVSPRVNILLEGFTISWLGVILGVAMGLLVPVLAAVIPVLNGVRVTILEAISDLGIAGSYGQGFMADVIRHLPLPATTKQALANIWQKRVRLALTGFTLTLAAGAFMGVSAVFISLDNTIGDIFETLNFEMMAFPQRIENYERASTLILDEIEGVAHIEPGSFQRVEVVTDTPGEPPEINLRGFEISGQSLDLHLLEGTAWNTDPEREGVVLTKSAAEDLGKKLGEMITFRYEDGQVEREISLEIIGIDSYPFPTAFTHWETVSELIREDENEPLYPEMLLIQLEDRSANAAQVENAIGDIRETLLRNGIFMGFYNQSADEEENTTLITIVGVIFNFASAVMAAIGAIGLLTTLSISVFERQREIGVMRSVGAGSGTIASQFLLEGLLIGLIAWLLGVPVSYFLGQALMGALPLPEFEFSYPIFILIAGFAGMIVLAIVASLYPSLSAARKTVSDILRYQ